MDYQEINRQSWNNRLEEHLKSDFYDNEAFLAGKSSLNSIELDLLGEIKNKSVLHLQCHFGQDSISLSRMGANVTGIDLSDQAIAKAQEFSETLGLNTSFINCDLYDLPNHLDQQFDIVFSSYGTIAWLPDLMKWAQLIHQFLKPGGVFVFVEFHPVIWIFDDEFQQIKYPYHNHGPIEELEFGTYANRNANISQGYVTWNHGLSEVLDNLLQAGLSLDCFKEFDYSPYDCFDHTIEFEKGKYRIKHLSNKIPMVYALKCIKTK